MNRILGARRSPRKFLHALFVGILSLALASMSLVLVGGPAHAATPGINASITLNGAEYDGMPVVNEGDEVVLRVQYNTDVVPGSTVKFQMSDNLSVSQLPPIGNSALESVEEVDGEVHVTFKDPWPSGVNQGVFELKYQVESVEKSSKEPITWTIDGEESSIEVIIREDGDNFANVEEGYAKSVSPSNLDGYVSIDNDGKVTVDPDIVNHDLRYTLRVSASDALTNFAITDVLPDELTFKSDSFEASLTTWDQDGLNQTTAPFPFNPTVSGQTMTANVDLPATSVLTITYVANVADVAALETALQAEADGLNLEAGKAFRVYLDNTATFGDDIERTARVRLRATIPGVGVGSAFDKTTDWANGTRKVHTDADGNLTPPAAITYTLKADLTKWHGQGANFTLGQNVVIADELPSQARWVSEDAEFVTTDGITLTEAPASVDCTVEGMAANAQVGQYCLDEQLFVANVGQDNTTNARIHLKAELLTVNGLSESGSSSVKDADTYRWRNTAEFHYRDGDPYKRDRDVTVVVYPDTDNGYNDSEVFVKNGEAASTSVSPGDTVDVEYTFTVGAGSDIDARSSQIIDEVDPDIFDISDLDEVTVTGTYDSRTLDRDDYQLSHGADGTLVIELSSSGKAIVETRGVDKRWVTTITMTTLPFEGKETKRITNRAGLVGDGEQTRYWSETYGESTSYGDEAEVRKLLYDPYLEEWVTQMPLIQDAEGNLYNDLLIYQIGFIPHGSYNGVVISDVVDTLPAGVDFIGFVDANDVEADNPEDGPVNVGGNIEASYDNGTVTLSQKNGTVLNANEPIAAYFAVKVVDTSEPIINTIDEVETIVEVKEAPSITIEKWSPTAVNGGEPGTTGPQYDEEGNLLNDGYVGDFDFAPGLGLDIGQDQVVIFTITNNGGEPLKDIVVTDQLLEGVGEIQGVQCLFPDESSGLSWPGLLNPGDVFHCSGIFPGFDEVDEFHTNLATVTGVGERSNETVTDEDPWNAYPKSYAIGDYTWIDTNRDGLQGEDEPVLPGVTVELFDNDETLLDTTVTDAQGRYLFDSLPAGEYQLRFTLTKEQAVKYGFTQLNAGDDPTIDSDAEPSSGWTIPVVLDSTNAQLTQEYDREFNATEGIDPTWDAGVYHKTYAIGDYTWVDTNRDGLQGKNEPVLPGVTVELFDAEGQLLATTVTDAQGRYLFDELPAGQYRLRFTLTEKQAAKYEFTQLNAGDDTTIDSDANPANGWTVTVTLGDANPALTAEYDREFNATEGIDPTWDAGVVELPEVEEEVPPPGAEGELPHTGSPVPLWLVLAGALALIGGVVLTARSRRRG